MIDRYVDNPNYKTIITVEGYDPLAVDNAKNELIERLNKDIFKR
jgi:hypothetical protein